MSYRSTKAKQLQRAAMIKENQWPLLSTNQGLVESGPFVMVPLAFLQHQYTELSATEVRVMLYIFYRTLGYRDPLTGGRKVADAISHSQFLKGITTHDDKQLDRGAGISERSLDRALDGLQEKGFIKRCRRTDRHGRQLTTMYELNLEAAGAAWLQSSSPRQTTANREQDMEAESQTAKIEAITYTSANDLSDYSGYSDYKLIEQGTEQTQQAPEVTSPDTFKENNPISYVKPEPSELDKILTLTTPVLQKHTNRKANGKADPAIFAAEGGSFAGIAPVKLRDTKESLNNQIINNQTQTGVVRKKKSKLTETKAKAPEPISFEVHQQEKAEQHALVSELTAVGVAHLEAKRLAAIAFANGHRAGGYVAECLQYIQRQTGVKSRIGLLVYLIKTNWQPVSANPLQPESNASARRARLMESWAKYSQPNLQSELEPITEDFGLSAIDNITAEFVSLCDPVITREKCEEVWREVCQKAIEEWGIAAEKLAGSWLAPMQGGTSDTAGYLRLYLTDPYQLISIRYKLSQLIKTALGLGPAWRIVDSDLVGHSEYSINDLAAV